MVIFLTSCPFSSSAACMKNIFFTLGRMKKKEQLFSFFFFLLFAWSHSCDFSYQHLAQAPLRLQHQNAE